MFAKEQEKIFEQTWFCAARGSDLARPGIFRTVQIGRESVILTRNRKGEPRAFFNICRHRGARLCSERERQVKRSFQCPYHAWTYDLDGKLIAAPNLTKMPDIGPGGVRPAQGARPRMARLHLGLRGRGAAVVRGHGDGCGPRPAGRHRSIDHYAVETLAMGRRIVYDVKANWKLIVENFMECYHCATIHPELTEVLPEFADGFAAQYFVGHGAEFGEDVKGFTVDGSEGLERLRGSPTTRTAATTR